jgi:hypothetical protein
LLGSILGARKKMVENLSWRPQQRKIETSVKDFKSFRMQWCKNFIWKVRRGKNHENKNWKKSFQPCHEFENKFLKYLRHALIARNEQ